MTYRVLFEANPHPMWVFERSTLFFLAVNSAAVHQYGYSEAEFLERTIAGMGAILAESRLGEGTTLCFALGTPEKT